MEPGRWTIPVRAVLKRKYTEAGIKETVNIGLTRGPGLAITGSGQKGIEQVVSAGREQLKEPIQIRKAFLVCE
jgi:hypothetical protein